MAHARHYDFRHVLPRDFCADLTDAQIAALAHETPAPPRLSDDNRPQR
jgi:hypothetical protein